MVAPKLTFTNEYVVDPLSRLPRIMRAFPDVSPAPAKPETPLPSHATALLEIVAPVLSFNRAWPATVPAVEETAKPAVGSVYVKVSALGTEITVNTPLYPAGAAPDTAMV